MRTVFLVQQDEADTARRMEKVLLSLPEDSGILFVSVSVIQDPLNTPGSRKTVYQVVVGCDRVRDVGLIELIVRTYLKQEVKDDTQLVIDVHRGIDRHSFMALDSNT